MLFKKLLTFIACSAIGTSVAIPTSSQAISFTEYKGEFLEINQPAKFKLNQENTSYSIPIASVHYGEASWYGPGLYGNLTASGATFRPGTMTAAHRYLPFGTRVRVTNLNNGRSRVVTINDRGPYVGGRIIDLAEGAAASLGVKSSGVASVRLEVLN